MRHGVFLAPFGPFADPGRVARLAARAEETGWDGFFVWDHVFYVDVQELADPWVTLAAVAGATERMTLGPMITPVPRRRMPKLARETVTLDRLAAGRLVLGVGLGSDRSGEFDRPGEEPDPRLRALLLDEGLDELTGLWRERAIPIWVGSKGLAGPPLRRAARWDGWFPVNVESPDEFAEGVARIRRLRDDAGLGDRPFEYAIELPRGDDPAPLVRAGATWLLTDFGSHPDPAEVADVVEAGPPPA